MKIIKTKNIISQVIYVYLAALITSAASSPLFGKIYLLIFKPINIGGLTGYENEPILILVQNIIFALPFFIPLFILIFVERKRFLVWFIGIILLFLIFYLGETKHTLWFVIFTVTGAILGWLIKLIYQKIKK